MPIFALFLLQGTDVTPSPPPPVVTGGMREWLIVIGAVVVVALLVGLWFVVALRSRRSGHRQHRHHRHDSGAGAEATDKSGSRRHRRHRHSDDFPRNPTLAETGGLPPIREERSRQGQRY